MNYYGNCLVLQIEPKKILLFQPMERFVKVLLITVVLLYFSEKQIFDILLYAVISMEFLILVIKQVRKRLSNQI